MHYSPQDGTLAGRVWADEQVHPLMKLEINTVYLWYVLTSYARYVHCNFSPATQVPR